MSDAPERIWAEADPERGWSYGAWDRYQGNPDWDIPEQEYVRADLHASLVEENARLREALERASFRLTSAASVVSDVARKQKINRWADDARAALGDSHE